MFETFGLLTPRKKVPHFGASGIFVLPHFFTIDILARKEPISTHFFVSRMSQNLNLKESLKNTLFGPTDPRVALKRFFPYGSKCERRPMRRSLFNY